MVNTLFFELMLLLSQLFFDASGITQGTITMSDGMDTLNIQYLVEDDRTIFEAEGQEDILTAQRFEDTFRYVMSSSEDDQTMTLDIGSYYDQVDLAALSGEYDFWAEFTIEDEWGGSWLLEVSWAGEGEAILSSDGYSMTVSFLYP